jgi:hypothetical protein
MADPGKGGKRTFGFPEAIMGIIDRLREAKERVDEVREILLEEEAAYLKSAIQNQELDLAPLTPDYLAWKVLKGLDPRVLMATREYVDKIGVYEDKSGSRYVGIPDENHTPAKEQGVAIPLRDLAKWLEFGTIRMVARPHYGPVHRRMMIKLPLRLAQAGFKVTQGGQRRGRPEK